MTSASSIKFNSDAIELPQNLKVKDYILNMAAYLFL